jgi:hypothetical protein
VRDVRVDAAVDVGTDESLITLLGRHGPLASYRCDGVDRFAARPARHHPQALTLDLMEIFGDDPRLA